MNKHLFRAALAVGALAIAWVSAGYLRSHPLALGMTALIAAFYAMGALELWRFQHDSAALDRALADIPAPLPSLDDWLGRLPAPLQTAVRLRIEGGRVALPGPAMAPYLTGLLVLLGMLGTFLGMVVTLQGTGAALERATDLQTMRDSLAAPVMGLGLAFGTSVAGVASSAMLGLMSALCRRQRLQVAQRLDALAAGALRPFTAAHRREARFGLLQQQAQGLPALVDQLQALALQLDSRARHTDEQLLASQQRFQAQAEAAYLGLATSVDQTLRRSLVDSAQVAAATLQPVVQATLGGIAQETAALQARLEATLGQQMQGLSSRFEASTGAVTDTWTTALAHHTRTSDALARQLGEALATAGQGLAQQAATLVDTVAQAQGALVAGIDERQAALVAGMSQGQASLLAAMAERHAGWADAQARRQATWLDQQAQQQASLLTDATRQQATLLDGVARQQAALGDRLADTVASRLAAIAAQLEGATTAAAGQWQHALARHEQQAGQLAQQALDQRAAAAAQFDRQSAALLQAIDQAQGQRDAAVATQQAQRLAAWSASLAALSASLQQAWEQAGEHTLARQAQICQTLEQTAGRMAAQAEAHARGTLAEIGRLVDSAAEAPRAAAELVGQLRDKLSDSLARDTAMLDERSRVMATLNTLLGAVQHTATAQKAAIDDLVGASATWLAQAGQRFDARADAESARLASVAAQLTGSAAEVASLGEAFGAGVAQFGQTSQQLMAHLQTLDDTLGRAIARSDEQLAYYVAQAREVVDLSLAAQARIVDDLQRIAAQRGGAAAG